MQEWVRTVCSLLLIFALMEILLPGRELARFARMVLGLMLIAAVCSGLPALPLLPALPSFSGQDAGDAWLAAGAAISAELEAEARRSYGADLAAQLADVAALAEGVQSAEARVELAEDAQPAEIRLTLYRTAAVTDEAAVAAAEALVTAFYPVSPAQLKWEVKEAADGGA